MNDNGSKVHSVLEEVDLYDQMSEVSAQLARMNELLERSQEVVSTRRYHLSEAAELLRLSERTLVRRAEIGKLVIIKDGKKPFVTGAEILRYMREGGKRRTA